MKLLCRFVWIASVPLWAQNSPTINTIPSREFGQAILVNPATSDAPNLLEGRELNSPSAVAFSPSSGVMYVADTSNNRVLAWLNPGTLTRGNQADKVIGQRDFYSNLQNGPGTSFSSGLRFPIGVAVDGSGNLYVLDAGNNRIVRYPNPFTQTNNPLSIDLVIGQTTLSSGNSPNEGQPKASNKTLFFSSGSTVFTAGMALDSVGNLWVADAGNNRVVRFPANQLTAGTIEPQADLQLGQPDLNSNGPPNCNNCQTTTNVLLQPQSLAFDGTGALYVADGYARVLYYPNPGQGVPASTVLGVVPGVDQGQPLPDDYSLGNSFQNAPLGVFASGNNIFVADPLANRVVSYSTPSQFVGSPTTPSPRILGVVGQPDLFSGASNRVQFGQPDATSLSAPIGGAFDSAGRLWVVDSGNNRVLSYPANSNFSFSTATIVVGQTDFPFKAPNLIEGKEVWIGQKVGTQIIPGGGIVVDTGSTPPHLYIADTYNNRVLGFKDARAVGTDERSLLTQKADLVIGQPDLFRAVVNYPGGNPNLPTSTGLLQPVGLAVDDSGNLWVADSGNGRVVRFPAPFTVAAGTIQTADTVVGQSGFTQKDPSASQQTMSTPYGLALFPDGSMAVSDLALNRVLTFRKPFTNGQAAFSVVGQANFFSSGASNSLAGLNAPRHIATDSVGRLYVCDTGNNRLIVFTNTSNIQQTGPASAFNFPIFSQPLGIAVNAASGEMWVATGNVIYHLPEITTFQTNTSAALQQIASNFPMAIALDSNGNPIVAEGINRITFYFAQLAARNAYSFTSTRPLTPGMWVQAAPVGKALGLTDQTQGPPYGSTLAGFQMLVNGLPAGVSAIGNKYINFNVPWNAPSSGTADFVLYKPDTGEIFAAGSFLMALADPAFKTADGSGFGQVLATNFDDGTRNGPQSPVGRGKIITLALTGEGPVTNPPPDGTAPSSLTPTSLGDLHVFINGADIGSQNVLSADLDPTFPGSWTINVQVPTTVPPCNAVAIFVTQRDVPSNYGFDPNNPFNDIVLQPGPTNCPAGGGNGRITTIAVK